MIENNSEPCFVKLCGEEGQKIRKCTLTQTPIRLQESNMAPKSRFEHECTRPDLVSKVTCKRCHLEMTDRMH